MNFIDWFNQFVFIICSIGALICLGMIIYSLVCFIRIKREQKRARKERDKERYLRWLQESNSVYIGKLHNRKFSSTYFVPLQGEALVRELKKLRIGPCYDTTQMSKFFVSNLPITDNLSEEERKEVKSRLAALEEYRRIQREIHKTGFFRDEQRPADWKPEKTELFFDNSFSIPNEEKIPRWHNPEAGIVYMCIGKQHNGREVKISPEISSCFCGGKGKLVRYIKCEGKDASMPWEVQDEEKK